MNRNITSKRGRLLKKNICKRSSKVFFLLLLFSCINFINLPYAKAAENLRQNNQIRETIIPEKFTQTSSSFTSNKNCETPPPETQYIKLGSRGHDVYCIQKQLKKYSLLVGEGKQLELDGIFGTHTKKIVLSFQKYHGLKQDGIVGSQTSQILWMPPVSALIRLLKQEDPNLHIRGSSGIRTMGTRISNSLSADVYEWSGYSRVGEGDTQNPEVKAAIPVLVKLLNDKNTNVRLSASDTLRWISSKSVPALATPTLIKLLEDKNPQVRKNATITLNFIAPDAATVAFNPLIKLLEDNDADVRKYALSALLDFSLNTKQPDGIEFAIKLLHDKDREVRVRAVEALGNMKAQAAVEPLIKLLEDEDSSVRGTAVNALGNIKAQAAVESIIKLLQDKDSYVRSKAAYALGKMKAQAAVEPLIQLLEDEDSEVRGTVVDALGNIKAQAALEPLIKILENDSEHYYRNQLDDNSTEIRIAVAEALVNIEAQTAVEPLIKLLEDKNPPVRRAAAYALGNMNVKAAVEPLIKLLADENHEVRQAAASILGNMKAKAAVQPLIKLLEKEDALVDEWGEWSIFSTVAEALEKINKQAAIEALIKILQDKENIARSQAVAKLGNMKAQAAVDSLIQHFKNENDPWQIRLNAFAALAKIESNKAKTIINSTIKSFIVEALQAKSGDFSTYGDFYDNFPVYKRHAFFLASIESDNIPSFSQALREILINEDYEYKIRYSTAFILGYIDSSSETIRTLNSVVNNEHQDFDIRWMSASSLARIGKDMNPFFTENNLINPTKVICDSYNVLDPFTGWCESESGAGGGIQGWFNEIVKILRGKNKRK